MANKTFSVRHGLDVANTIVLDSNRNLLNIANANVITVNATTFVTSDGLDLRTHTNNAYTQANTAGDTANDAYSQANNAANTVRVSQNGSSTLSGKQLNFVNTSSVLINITDSGDGNANIAISTSGASPGDAYNQANNAYAQANASYAQANDAYAQANSGYSQANASYGQANAAYGQANNAYAEANNRVLKTGDTMTGTLNIDFNAGNTALNVNGRAEFTTSIQVGNSNTGLYLQDDVNGFATLELGGAQGGYIDFKMPVDEDYDFRIYSTHAQTEFISARTDHEVAFMGSNVSFNTSVLAIDVINNRVGVGSNTPDANLTVIGNANITTSLTTNIANVVTINANTFVTSAGLNVTDQANNAYAQANASYDSSNNKVSKAGDTITGDLIITGNLTVSGNTTTLNTETLTVEDADIVLLSNVVATPALNAGIIINRGTSPNTFLRWAENVDKWGWSDDGTTFYEFDSALNAYAQANSARDQANSSYSIANNAYDQANSAYATANAPITIKEIYAGNSTVVNTFTNINTIQFDADSGMAVVDEGTNTVTIQLNSTFKYWNVDGSPGLEAFGLDTVNFIAGSGITISANNNASPKSITFTANGGGGGGGPGSTRDSFTGTGACTTFTLSTNPPDENYTIVFIGGVLQGDSEYNLVGSNVVFTVAPPNNTPIEVYTIGSPPVTNNISVVYTTDGIANTYSLGFTPANNNNILVSLDGINMIPTTDYTCSGANLTLTFLPPSNIVLEARSLQQ